MSICRFNLIIFRLEVLILKIQNNNSELNFEGSNQLIIENLNAKFSELKYKFSYWIFFF
jgi:hypothetical protein